VRAMAEEPRIEMDYFGGSAPVQAWGTINGRPFYFRARHAHWSFAVSLDPTVDPADIAYPDQGFYREEIYDVNGPASASYMPHDEAETIIRRCVAQFIEDSRTEQ